jgi:hypothetical protein
MCERMSVCLHLTGHKSVDETGNIFQKTNDKVLSPSEGYKPIFLTPALLAVLMTVQNVH